MTDQNKTPEQLIAEERDRLQTILTAAVECLPFGFWALGADGRYIMQNAANRARWGDILGKTPAEVARDETTLSVWLENNRRAFAGEKVEADVEFTAKGETRSYHNVIAPIRKGEQILGILGVNIDVTDRKQVEATLRESEERFQAFMDHAPSIAWMKDEQGRHVYRSKPAQTRYGFRTEDWLGKTDFEIWPRQIAEQLRKNDLAVLASGQVLEVIEETTGRDGRPRCWWSFKFPFRDASGKRYVGGVGVDITERERTEAALRESERRFRMVLENSPDAAYRRDLATNDYDYMSPAIEHLTGFPAEEIARMSMAEVLSRIHPEDAPSVADTVAEMAEGKTAKGLLEYRFRGQDGVYRWLADRFRVLKDNQGRPLYLLGIVRDISDRKRAEEALRRAHDELDRRVKQRTEELSAANHELQTIYDGIVEGLLITDVQTRRFVRVNSALCRMLGYSEEEVLAASLEDIHPPEERSNDLARFQAVAEGRVLIHEDRPVLKKDGGIIYADIVGHPIVYGGRPCTLALFHDVTERKRAQEALQRQRRTLQRLFRSSDHERQLIAYEIHDGLAQFLAGAIMQFDASVHLKDAAPTGSAKAFETGMMMLRQGHAEARRLISGVRPLILDEEGIVAAIAHLIHEQRGLEGPKIELHSLVDFERLVAIQESTIYRIVQEGLTNACKHSQAKRVRVELVQQGDSVRIVVQDWGVGFDPGQIGESCCGLEGIRERARLLGGTCSVESTLGEGTRLSVELPLVVRENDE